jgi:hypothetical protein
LTFTDCVFRGPAVVVDHRGDGGLALTLKNTLCVDAGPIVRQSRTPRADESLSLRLTHVTTRGRGAVLECRYGRLSDHAPAITVTAASCALALAPHGGLVIFSGSTRPESLVRGLTWQGEGSIVTPDTDMLLWRATGRRAQAWPEEELEIAGLVRSDLEFAGPADGPPANSRVTTWQVPLRSDDPPGANPRLLAPTRSAGEPAALSRNAAGGAQDRSATTR